MITCCSLAKGLAPYSGTVRTEVLTLRTGKKHGKNGKCNSNFKIQMHPNSWDQSGRELPDLLGTKPNHERPYLESPGL